MIEAVIKVPRKHCWKRLRRHRFGRKRVLRGDHRYKICKDCKKMIKTHHVSCSVACWGGPG